MDNIHFLIGGSDLEMKTILKIFQHKGVKYFDKSLMWGPKLSSYLSELKALNSDNSIKTIYGIELINDITDKNILSKYVEIDHHNENYLKSSAIEQIADIIAHHLSRYELLVAANDKGYIPAMEAMGASTNEIIEIRAQDRFAQGVSSEDEAMAEDAIKNRLTQYGDLIVVHSNTSCFSPICDQLHPCKMLIIYTNEELTYYGEKKMLLVDFYMEDIKLGKMYHGGGDQGYIGSAKGEYSAKKIIEIVEQIKTIIL
jgi:hypothetical protein